MSNDNTTRVINLDEFYNSPVQACMERGWSMPDLYRRIRKGEVESVMIGRTRLIKRQEKLAS